MNLRSALAGPGLFRFVLALIVFMHHVSRLALGPGAVYVFFALSGYWICVMWNTRYSQCHHPYATFVLSRFWRLFPVFALCNAIAWGLIIARGVPFPSGLNWSREVFSHLFILGYGSLPFQPNDPGWSLDIELQFYLIAPFLIIALRKGPWALVVCAVLSFGAYLAGATETVFPYVIFFAAGAAASTFKWVPSKEIALGAVACATAAIVLCVASPFRGVLLGGAHPDPMVAFNEQANVVLAIMIIPWAIYTTNQKGVSGDSMFGDLSFIVYLLHWPVLQAMDVGAGSYGQRAIDTLEAFISIVLASWVIWKFFDRPINKRRSDWVSRRIRFTASTSNPTKSLAPAD